MIIVYLNVVIFIVHVKQNQDMKRIATILIVLIIVSCTQTKVDKKAEGEKVMQVSKEWSQSIAKGCR
jgi:hypothetical protein